MKAESLDSICTLNCTSVNESQLLKHRVCPLGLGIVLHHLAEGDVVDIDSPSDLHVSSTVCSVSWSWAVW